MGSSWTVDTGSKLSTLNVPSSYAFPDCKNACSTRGPFLTFFPCYLPQFYIIWILDLVLRCFVFRGLMMTCSHFMCPQMWMLYTEVGLSPE